MRDSSKPGATTHSMNRLDIASAAASSMRRFTETTEPNALTPSVARARSYAASTESPTANPHGVVCLTMQTAAFGEYAKGASDKRAPSRSSKLLYDNFLPCICSSPARPSSRSGQR